MKVDYSAIGQRINAARLKKGYTQEQVANLIDITPPHMSNIETGHTKVSLPTLVEIANALSVTLDQLMCDCLIASGDIYKNEISSLLEDCSYHEVKVIADIIHATKQSMRKNLKSNITDDIK